jgi:putative glutathione S-transferase
MSSVHPNMLSRGWEFIPTHPNYRDPLNYCRSLYEIYLMADPFYTGRVTVPVLWDKKQHEIVSNESSEIIRMFNSAFAKIAPCDIDYYPNHLQMEIDLINQFVYENINNGVYRCGFATTQEAYDKAFDQLFSALDVLDKRLENQTFLIKDTITEADWRLFTTLVRFDMVYYSHFKCNLKMIKAYPNLYRYLKQLYMLPKIAETVKFDEIKQHYYYSQITINPFRIVPKGPICDLD